METGFTLCTIDTDPGSGRCCYHGNHKIKGFYILSTKINCDVGNITGTIHEKFNKYPTINNEMPGSLSELIEHPSYGPRRQ